MKLATSSAFLTGGAMGVGEGIAEALLKNGAKLRGLPKGIHKSCRRVGIRCTTKVCMSCLVNKKCFSNYLLCGAETNCVTLAQDHKAEELPFWKFKSKPRLPGKVCIADVNKEQGKKVESRLQATYGQDRVKFVFCDVTKEDVFKEAFKEAVETCGPINIMINNAGMIHEKKWQYMMDVNVGGVVIGTNLAVEHMRTDKGGKGGVIINTASFAGLDSRFVFPIYAASKAAVVHFTSSWAANPHLKDMGIRFASVNPTAVDTLFQKFNDEQVLYPDDFRQMLKTLSLLPVERCVEGFMHIIEDDDSNGTVLVVSLKHGICPMKLDLVKA